MKITTKNIYLKLVEIENTISNDRELTRAEIHQLFNSALEEVYKLDEAIKENNKIAFQLANNL